MLMPKAYEGKEPYIFISYAHKDSEKVIPIITALQSRGFRVWFDAGIAAGSEWPLYIATQLMNCSCFIPFLTDNYTVSDNCRQEIHFALRKKRAILPVYLEDVELDVGLDMQLSPIQALFLQPTMAPCDLLPELEKSSKLSPCLGEIPAPPAAPAPTPAAPQKPAAQHTAPQQPAPAPQPVAPPKPKMSDEFYREGYRYGSEECKEAYIRCSNLLKASRQTNN